MGYMKISQFDEENLSRLNSFLQELEFHKGQTIALQQQVNRLTKQTFNPQNRPQPEDPN